MKTQRFKNHNSIYKLKMGLPPAHYGMWVPGWGIYRPEKYGYQAEGKDYIHRWSSVLVLGVLAVIPPMF